MKKYEFKTTMPTGDFAKDLIKSLIEMLKENDKETVISLLEILATPSEELTLEDAYNEAYGSALMQIYAQTNN